MAARYPDTVSQIGGTIHVSGQTPVIIGPPLSGDGWEAGNGCCGLTSHRGAMMPAGGRLNGGERFAIDWVRFDLADDPLTTLHGDICRNHDYLAYDADVLAVADGTVVSVVSDMPDEPPQQAPTDLGIDQLGGNSIIIDIGHRNDAFFAHLIPGSATVHPGDHVGAPCRCPSMATSSTSPRTPEGAPGPGRGPPDRLRVWGSGWIRGYDQPAPTAQRRHRVSTGPKAESPRSGEFSWCRVGRAGPCRSPG